MSVHIHRKKFTSFYRKRSIRIIGIIALVVGVIPFFSYHLFIKKAPKQLYKTEKAARKTIEQVIPTSGSLELKDAIKVGSLVPGIVKKIYAKENQLVKKGELLALIDNGKDDTEVRQAQGVWEKAKAVYAYQREFYHRQKQLYLLGHIASDTFQNITSVYRISKADAFATKATLEQKQIEYNNTFIRSPEDGIITDLGVSEGERVQTDLEATVLFYIGKNLNLMEGQLEIDESDIGQIKKGQKVRFTVDSYLDVEFSGVINNVGYSPTSKNNVKYYKAYIEVDNSAQLLRPGMTMHAKVDITRAENVLVLTNQAFQVDQESLEKVAKALKYECVPLKEEVKKNHKNEPTDSSRINDKTKYVWIVKDKKFLEKAVVIGATDNIHFQAKSGINPDDQIVIDVEEANDMDKLYKQWFGGAL